MKKVLVISTSLRPRSNSEALADEFVRGAQEAGNEVEKVTLRGKDIRFCKGCLVCQKTQECVIKDDDAPAIVRKMYEADAICFATPIYYYEMSGQMKTLLDRANPLYTMDYHSETFTSCRRPQRTMSRHRHGLSPDLEAGLPALSMRILLVRYSPAE